MSVLSGLLLTLSFPKPEVFFLAWGALVPLLVAVRGSTPPGAFALGWLCGLVHYLTALYWIHHVVAHYGGLPSPLSLAILVLLCGYLAVYPALFAVAALRLQSRPLWRLVALPAAWVTLEWIRAHALTGFPWASLGYSQTPWSTLIQAADVTGVYGVSALVALANVCWVNVMEKRGVVPALVVPAACLGLVLFYGDRRLEQIRGLLQKTEVWTVGVIQGNIDQGVKWDPSYQKTTLERYERLTLQAFMEEPPPELVVWPETAVPFFYGLDAERSQRLKRIVREAGSPLLFGSPGVIEKGREVPRLQNRAYLLDPERGDSGSYAKRHLVPFGEYVPLSKVLFFINKLVEAVGTFSPGDDPSPLELEGKELGVLICYEAIFPRLARETVNGGASVLVNITNDAWFGDSGAPYQHLEMARWRAVEFRRPFVRAANTGVSSIFDATGKGCGRIALDTAGFLVCPVRPLELKTFYARRGDWFAWVCMAATLAALLPTPPSRKTFFLRNL